MSNAFKGFGLAALILTGGIVHANVLIEPFGGYQIGTAKQSGQPNVDYKMTNYGARVGYVGSGFMTGVEYLTGQGNEEDTKGKTKPTTMGIFIGYTFPVLLRIYGVYAFDAKFDRTVVDTTDSYSEGSTVKAGIGITSLSFVAINLEYISGVYNKFNNKPIDHKYVTGSYGLSLSFPIAF